MFKRQLHINLELRTERLKKARVKGTHTKKEWLSLVKKYNYCVRCKAKNVLLTKDHIIPIYQGGSDSIDNLQPLCRKCNSQKGPDTTNWLK